MKLTYHFFIKSVRIKSDIVFKCSSVKRYAVRMGVIFAPVQMDHVNALRQTLGNKPSGGIIFTTIQKFALKKRG